MFNDFFGQLYSNIIAHDRYLLYLSGLGITIVITLIAVIIGVILGSFVAITKVYAINNPKLKFLNGLCDVYLTVFRGTPIVVQLLIFYYVIFFAAPSESAPYVAALTFGINSGAYVAEIIRAGIMAVDRGQTEAGRSLGLSNNMTMRFIIFPQAIKNILPALGNEVIVLFKETAVVGYVAVMDLTMVANLIRSRTFQPLVPLLFTALIYLGVVMLLTFGQRKLERYLSRSDTKHEVAHL